MDVNNNNKNSFKINENYYVNVTLKNVQNCFRNQILILVFNIDFLILKEGEILQKRSLMKLILQYFKI